MKLIAPKFWQCKSILAYLLLPFSLLYLLISRLYAGSRTPYKATPIVICVGNITMGGAGKTPTAIAIAKLLIAQHKSVCFLTRGYQGSYKHPMKVDLALHNAELVGDEALVLAKIAPVYVAKDRSAGAKLAEADKIDIIIMDDGMQNNSLHKDLEILVVDGSYGFGNHFPFPAGPLRETISQGLYKTNLVVLIGEDKHHLMQILSTKQTVRADICVKTAQQNINHTSLGNINYLAFAGIARPEKFFTTLQALGSNVVKTVAFGDHYYYTSKDIRNLLAEANKLGAQLITTEKDLARINQAYHGQIETMPIELSFSEDITKFLVYEKN